jgi:hypothetical protein
LAGACALHLLAGWGLHQFTPAKAPGTPPSHASPIILTRASPEPSTAARREGPPPHRGSTDGPGGSGPQVMQDPGLAQQEDGHEPGFQGRDKFYTISEVDQPASPTVEWQLDTAVLRPGVLYHATLDVLIDQDGRIVQSTIIRLEPEDWAARAALARLSDTRMLPARLHGNPVASRRHIELQYGVE